MRYVGLTPAEAARRVYRALTYSDYPEPSMICIGPDDRSVTIFWDTAKRSSGLNILRVERLYKRIVDSDDGSSMRQTMEQIGGDAPWSVEILEV